MLPPDLKTLAAALQLSPELQRQPESVRRRLRMRYLYPDCLCSYCGSGLTRKSFSVDHVEPRNVQVWKRRGIIPPTRRDWDNLVPACKRCNHLKRDYRLLQFLLSGVYQQRLSEVT